MIAAPSSEQGIVLSLWSSDGETFSAAAAQPPAADVAMSAAVMPLDLAGIGRPSIVYVSPDDSTGQRTLAIAQSPAVGAFPDLIGHIVNGLGGSIEITYAPLSDGSVYSAQSTSDAPTLEPLAAFNSRLGGASYRTAAPGAFTAPAAGAAAGTQVVAFPRYVVSSHTMHDGRGGAYTYAQSYAQALLDLTGRGWLGFASVTCSDSDQGTTAAVSYNQAFPLTATIAGAVTRRTADASLMHDVSSTYSVLDSSGAQIVQLQHTAAQQYTFGTLDWSATTAYLYDEYGNPTTVTESSTSAHSLPTYTSHTYQNDPDQWRLGYLTGTVISADSAQQHVLRRMQRHYDPVTLAVLEELTWEDQHGRWLSTIYGYDALGNRTAVTDPSGATHGIKYDATYSTFPAKVTTPELGFGGTLVTTVTHDPLTGVELTRTDPNGVLTSQTIDGLGRVTGTDGPSPSGATVALTTRTWNVDETGIYLQDASLSEWSAGTWRWTRSYLDGLAREVRTATLGPDGVTTILVDRTFSGAGQVLTQTLPYTEGATGSSVTNVYDAYRRLTQTVIPPVIDGGASVTTTLSYPAFDTTVRTEAAGTKLARQVTVIQGRYAAAPRIVEVTQPDGSQTVFAYDALGRLIGATDAAAENSYAFDSLGRQLSATVIAGGKAQLQTATVYDDIARTVTQTDAAGTSIVSQLDPLGRLVSKAVAGQSPTVFRYDLVDHPWCAGRLGQIVLPDGSTTDYGYDPLGRQVNIKTVIDGQSYALARQYSPLGGITGLTYPDGIGVVNVFNAAGTITSSRLALDTAPYAAYTQFDPFGRPRQIELGNGTSEQRTYDRKGRILTLEVLAPDQTPLLSHQYRWNALDQLDGITDLLDAGSSENFIYDPVGRLKEASGPYPDTSYGYDQAGSLTLKDGVTFTCDGYQLVSGACDGTEVLSTTYDPAGNLTVVTREGVSTEYGYDGERRLATAGGMSFGYDHSGERIKRVMPDGTVTHYLGSLFETTTAPGEGAVETCRLPGFGGTAATLESSPSAGCPSTLFEHSDHLGSIRLQTDAKGSVATALTYTPWGEVAQQTGPDQATRMFAAKELDATGLYYFGARYYDPALGRFMTADDRVQGDLTRSGILNLYSYGLGDPVANVDPTGHISFSSIWRSIGGADLVHAVVGFARLHVVQDIIMASCDVGLIVGGIALVALTPFTGAGVLGSVALGAGLSGLVTNIQQWASGKNPNWAQWGIQLGIGGAAGLASAGVGAVGDLAVKGVNEWLIAKSASYLLGRTAVIATRALVGTVGGFPVAVGAQLLSNWGRGRPVGQSLGWSGLVGAATGGLASGLAEGLTPALRGATGTIEEDLVGYAEGINATGRVPEREVPPPSFTNLSGQDVHYPAGLLGVVAHLVEQGPNLVISYGVSTAVSNLPQAPEW
jgi:RHS repeat-associated protein